MKSASVVLLLLICHISFAQLTYQKKYGGSLYDETWSFTQTSDGGCVLAGFTTGTTNDDEDIYLIKTADDGSLLWTRTFGSNGTDKAASVQQTTDNGYILTGYSDGTASGKKEIILIRTNENGDTLWTRSYGKPNCFLWANSVIQTSDGGFFITGSSYTEGDTTIGDIVVIKTNPSGDTLWTRIIGNIGTGENGNSGIQTNDGGFIIAGVAQGFGAGDNDMLLVKTDPAGLTQWAKTYGDTCREDGYAVVQTADNGYAVNGFTLSFGAGDADICLLRTDSSGNAIWLRAYGGKLNDFVHTGNSLDATSDGGFVTVGWSWNFGSGGDEAYLIKTDDTGDTLWTWVVSGPNSDVFCGVQETADHGYIIAGMTANFPVSPYSSFLVRTDNSGYSGCNSFRTITDVSEYEFLENSHFLNNYHGLFISRPDLSSGTFGQDTTLCTTVNITEVQTATPLLVFPNPVSGEARVQFDHVVSDAALMLINAMGQTVLIVNHIYGNEVILQRGDLPAGLYVIRITEQNCPVATGRIIISE